MPELPEVQALSERLNGSLAGARFAAVEPLAFSALKTVVPPPEALVGRRVETVGRRGKFLTFDAEGLRLLVHLSQGGRIDLLPASTGGRPRGGVVRFRDQRQVAGIGRGYADDILHRAKLSPYRSLASLERPERDRLLEAVRNVLSEALEAERRRIGGLPTKLGDHFGVHGRYGTPCPVCGADLRRVSYQSHEVTYCPNCQTGGKILADRRLSRLVR